MPSPGSRRISKGQELPLGADESVAHRLYLSPLCDNRRIFLTAREMEDIKDRLEEKKKSEKDKTRLRGKKGSEQLEPGFCRQTGSTHRHGLMKWLQKQRRML